MVVFPDTHAHDMRPSRIVAHQPINETSSATPLKRFLLACFGAASVLAALGVWMVPVEDGDNAMRMMKLVFSLAMLALGALFISALDGRHSDPEIHLDPATGCLRVVETGKDGAGQISGEYNLKDFSEITLQNGHLTAQDVRGQQALSVPVRDPLMQKAIRELLEQIV